MLFLVVSDIPIGGPAPNRASYGSLASFSDPDDNRWLLQEVTARLPGRVDTNVTTFTSPAELAAAMHRAAVAHGEHEERNYTMNIKAISLGAFALFAVGGTALAGALDVADNLAPFYTDASMKTMKPMPEFKAAFMAKPQPMREMIMRECNDAAMSKPYAEFCANVNALGGMK